MAFGNSFWAGGMPARQPRTDTREHLVVCRSEVRGESFEPEGD